MKLDYNEIKDYHDKGLLDSMRLSLGLPWESILDTILSHESGYPEKIETLEDKLATLEEEAESDYNLIQSLQEDLQQYEDYVAPRTYNEVKYELDQLQADYDYLVRSSKS